MGTTILPGSPPKTILLGETQYRVLDFWHRGLAILGLGHVRWVTKQTSRGLIPKSLSLQPSFFSNNRLLPQGIWVVFLIPGRKGPLKLAVAGASHLRVPRRHRFLVKHAHLLSVAFCSPAKSLTFRGLMENPLVGNRLKS